MSKQLILRLVLFLVASQILKQPLLSAGGDSISIYIAAGRNQSIILDEFLSPMQYRGKGFLIRAGFVKSSDKYYNHVGLIFQKNNIKPDIVNNSSADLHRGSIDWLRAWKLNQDKQRPGVFLGGHFLTSYTALSHKTWNNNTYSHNLAISLGPSLVLSSTLTSSIDLVLTWEVSLPLVSYILRPSLGSIYPERVIQSGESTIGSFMTGGRITSLHEYQRIYSNLYASYRIKDQFGIKAGYSWDFQNYSVHNQFQSANHLFYLGSYFKFGKK